MAKIIKKFLKSVEDVLYPDIPRCVKCGKDLLDGYFCEKCIKDFHENVGNRCANCSRPTVSPDDVVCERCKTQSNVFDKAFSPIIYKGTALGLLLAFKYNERRDLGKFFVDYMEKEYEKVPDIDFILPVPMWRGKEKDRVYSTAHELGELLSKRVDKPIKCDLVEKIRDTGTQTSLSREERQENVKGCFSVLDKKEIKNKKILIVDDVYTTGATANELARVLKKAKADKIYVLTATIATSDK